MISSSLRNFFLFPCFFSKKKQTQAAQFCPPLWTCFWINSKLLSFKQICTNICIQFSHYRLEENREKRTFIPNQENSVNVIDVSTLRNTKNFNSTIPVRSCETSLLALSMVVYGCSFQKHQALTSKLPLFFPIWKLPLKALPINNHCPRPPDSYTNWKTPWRVFSLTLFKERKTWRWKTRT